MDRIVLKFILIGDVNSGKSSLFHHFIHDKTLLHSTTTVKFDHASKVFRDDNLGIIEFRVWDTPGSERYSTSSLTQAYYRDTDVVLILFDLTDRTSFESVTFKWLTHLQNHIHSMKSDWRFMIVGTKSDLTTERKVSEREANELAKKLNVFYMEISTSHSSLPAIQQIFFKMALSVIDANPSLTHSIKKNDSFYLSDSTGTENVDNQCCQG